MLCFRCGSHNPDGSEFCQHCGQNLLPTVKPSANTEGKSVSETAKHKTSGTEKDGLQPGQTLAERYQIKSLLGAGPTGVVWRARDLEIEVEVAVKIIHSKLLQTREERKQFQSVIRLARSIQHPNVVRIYDEDQDNERCFFTMQLLEGLSLRKIIHLRVEKGQKFNTGEIEPIFSHLCQALEKAHETTVHAILKPENVIILPDILKVTDFGIFEGLPRKPMLAAQKAAARAGAYLAPELREGDGKPTPAADIYSLGVILCEMLTGQVYEGPSYSLPDLTGQLSRWQRVLVRALNENPSRRHASVREFFSELSQAAGGVTTSSPPRPAPRKKATVESKAAAISKPEHPKTDQDNYPPTVVDAEFLPDEEEPAPSVPVTEDEIIEDLAAAEEPAEDAEDLVAEEQHLEEVATSGDEAAARDIAAEEEFSEGETVTAPGPPAPAPAPPLEARVARPLRAGATESSRRPPISIPASPPVASAPVAASPQPAPTAARPSYGPFSQPPFPPSFVTQPPMPKPVRLPVYLFLFGLLVIVAVGVYFFVDYLRAQAELARVQAQAAMLKAQAVVAPVTVQLPPPSTPEPAPVAAAPTSIESPQPAKPTPPQEPVVEPLGLSAPAPTPPATPAAAAVVAKEEVRPAEKSVAAGKETRRHQPLERVRESKKAAPPTPAPTAPRPAVAATEPGITAPVTAALPRVEEPPEVTSPVTAPTPATPSKPETAAPAVAAVPVAPVSQPSVTPEPAKEVATVSTTGRCPAGMIYIPAGKASIGSSSDDPMRNFGELLLHQVDVGAYCIDLYEYPNLKGKKPLGGVSFNEAKNLCRKRGKRLCSETEWEYACKGAGNRRFPYGNQWSADACNTKDAGGADRPLAESGAFAGCRSQFGTVDMSGNLSEWTDTPFSPGAPAMTYKGGSSLRPDWATRCAARSSAQPSMRKDDLGFRCCADAK